MSNIIPFDATPSGKAELPAHIAAAFGSSNIPARASIDQLSYRGKVWRRVVDGEETVLTKPDPDNPGEQLPIPVVGLVVLDMGKQRSRAFYEGGYEEGKNAKPACYSRDGVKPDESVKEPQCATCAACPQAVKGSKITENNKQTTACSQFKRIAVIPAAAKAMKDHPVMLLRIAQTSMWDKENGENEAKGWYAWDQYLDMLRSRGVNHTGAVETRVKFDQRMAYPKLLFSANRWLSPEEAALIKGRLETDATAIENIITAAGNSDGVMGQANGASGTQTAGASAAEPDDTAAQAQAAAEAAAKAEAEKKAKAAAAAAAKKKKAEEAAAAAEAAAEAAAKAAQAAADDDDGGFGAGDDGGFGGESAAAAPAPAAAAAPVAAAAPAAAVETGTPSGLKDLLNNWDD